MGKEYCILGLDPGDSTGVALVSYSDTEPARLEWSVTVTGGVHGFADWWADNGPTTDYHIVRSANTRVHIGIDAVVSEKFIVEPSFTGDNESLKIEGALVALWGGRIHYQLRSDKETLLPGKSETKRFQWLRELGFDGTPHELDAVTHCLVRLRKQFHVPTLEFLYKK